jgi:curved DNA-binding protein CbpA
MMKRGFAVFNYKREDDNLYTVLKIKTTAVPKEVKLAYYKMAKAYHPDFNSSKSDLEKEQNTEMFKKVHKAYEVLSNPISR